MQSKFAKLFPLYLAVFLAFLGYSMMITIFTPMVIFAPYGSLEERILWLGVLLALYPIGQILGGPLIFRLASQVGLKKGFLFSIVVTALGYACIALSLTCNNIFALGWSIFLTGISESNVSMADKIIIDSALTIRRSQWISYIEGSKSSSFFIGPLFGGILSKTQISLPFWIISFFLIAAVLWLMYWLPYTKPKKIQPFFLNTWKKMPMYPFLINFLAYFAIFGFFRAYPVDLVDRFHLDISALSFFIAWVAVPMLLITFLLNGFFLKFLSSKKLAALGSLSSGCFMLILPFIKDMGYLMYVDLFLIGMGIGFCLPNATFLIGNGLRKRQREQVIETDESYQLGAEAISSIIGGVCGMLFIQLPLIVFAISALGASFFLSRIKSDNKHDLAL